MTLPTTKSFKELEASRAPFDASLSSEFHVSQTPDPNWKPGQGCNEVHDCQAEAIGDGATGSEEAGGRRYAQRIIVPGETEVDPMEVYRLLHGFVAPRPIALVTTQSTSGQINLCPMSWFQLVSHDPPLVMLSFGGDEERRKDSEVNVEETREFTISSVSESYAEAANFAAAAAPKGLSEYALTGLTPIASHKVRPPRVKEAPFSIECRLDFRREYYRDGSAVNSFQHDTAQTEQRGRMTTVLVIGRIVAIHFRPDCIDGNGFVVR